MFFFLENDVLYCSSNMPNDVCGDDVDYCIDYCSGAQPQRYFALLWLCTKDKLTYLIEIGMCFLNLPRMKYKMQMYNIIYRVHSLFFYSMIITIIKVRIGPFYETRRE